MKKKKTSKKSRRKKKSFFLRFLFKTILLLILFLLGAAGVLYLYVDYKVKNFIAAGYSSPNTSTIYALDENGQDKPLAPLYNSRYEARTYQKLSDFPSYIPEAVMTIEDDRFYDHFGIDLIGTFRALTTNIRKGAFVQGGSTITQQLAKNTLFSPKKTIQRKVFEALAAISLERRLSKEKILELYLNEVYLAQSGQVAIHGIPSASKFFFDKKISEITLAEAALLAAIIKAPSYYAPDRHKTRALERRNLVLKRMYEHKDISEASYQKAKTEKLIIKKQNITPDKSSYFVSTLRQHIENSYKINKNKNVKIITGLNLKMQRCAEEAITLGLQQIEKQYSKLKNLQAGLVALETYSGLVKAWVGGRNYQKSQFDRVRLAKRQLGSTVKPFVYLTALDSSLNNYKVATPITILTDEPIEIETNNRSETWTPKNYNGNFLGAVTLRYALERSLNIPAVYVTQKVSPQAVARTIKKFAVAKNPPAVPAIALGAIESTLLNLTSAYGAIANGGILVKPRLYLSMNSEADHVINYSKIEETQVANERPVFVLTNLMQGVVERGTGKSIRNLGFNLPVAGKTGTTNDARDAWFIGFTPDVAAGVWVGLDNNKPIGLTGSQAAIPIWTEFMKCSQSELKKQDFVHPRGVVFVNIDSKTGNLYNSQCAGQAIREIFVRGTEPYNYCSDLDKPIIKEQSPPKKNKKYKSIFNLLFD